MYRSAGGPPKVFGAVTAQLHVLRDWLEAQGVRSVAMEATGVYWLPLYGVLEAAGFEVRMVNGRQTRNLPGRKTDMQDCQWGATLHSHGLLRAGFVPPAHIRRMQDYMRLRADHISMAATHVQHMQQALERMNIKLHDVIAKLTGVSGLAVVRAVLGGERDPQRLLALCDRQIATRQGRAGQGVAARHLDRGASVRARAGAAKLGALPSSNRRVRPPRLRKCCCTDIDAGQPPDGGAAMPARPSRPGVNAPQIPTCAPCSRRSAAARPRRNYLRTPNTASCKLIGEVGTDLTRWRTEKHFTSWMGLAPGSHQSGKRKRSVKRSRNRAGRLFCVMARSLARSKDIALGGFYRRMAARRGGLVANIALARKLAVLFWRVMVKGMDYVELGLQQYEAKVLETKQRSLRRLARQLGQQLVPMTTPVPTRGPSTNNATS